MLGGKGLRVNLSLNVGIVLGDCLKLSKTRLCVIGLGQVGLPVAQYAHAKGLEVWGYDINPVTVENAGKSGKFKVTCLWKDVPRVDAYVICVTTGQVGERPDLSAVFDVCRKISEKADSSSLVSVESTIVPGASKKIYEAIFKSRINLVHVPHRYWADEPVKHGVNQLRVIGAVNSESLKAGLELYRGVLGIPLHVCSSVEVAEMCKITENSHRYLQIAFAEELRMMCKKIGISFDDLRKACNTKWNVDIPEARDGIGRHCLPKDVRYVTSLAPSAILESAVKVDKEYREWLKKQQ
ncbi:NAD(P)-binding domain-containing protein [Candidatus Bathyarchaeota archaeon]|nr:NAD(P)-binding domain-containing protein [Candidatus Bathyarchaeota archaeon]